jgi:hypothetical protein
MDQNINSAPIMQKSAAGPTSEPVRLNVHIQNVSLRFSFILLSHLCLPNGYLARFSKTAYESFVSLILTEHMTLCNMKLFYHYYRSISYEVLH